MRVILYFARLVVLPQVNEHCSAGFAWETLVDSSIPRNKSYASVQVFRSRSNIARQSWRWFLYAIFSGGHLVDGDVPSTKHIDNFLWMLSGCLMGGENVEVIILEHWP